MRVCRYWGHSPSREPVKSPRPPPRPGDPLPQHRDPRAPPAHFAKARKRPSRRQRNSCLLHSRPLRPPQTLPGALPRPRRQRARTCREREAGWASPLPDADQLQAGSAPCPGTPSGSRAPTLRPPNSSGLPAQPPPAKIVPRLSSGATGGRGAHKAGVREDAEYQGGKRSRQGSARAQAQLFTRFLLRSPRCLRR